MSEGPQRAYCAESFLCERTRCVDECKLLSLCISPHPNAGRRYTTFGEVHGPCATDADCQQLGRAKCVTARRCDLLGDRTEEAGRIVEAARTPAPSIPAAYTAEVGGPPPTYPKLVVSRPGEPAADDPSAKSGCGGCDIGSSPEGGAVASLASLLLILMVRRRSIRELPSCAVRAGRRQGSRGERSWCAGRLPWRPGSTTAC
jgi:hypothetical protein